MHPCVYPYNFTLRHLTASQSLTEAELRAEDAADIPDMECAGRASHAEASRERSSRRASSAARLGHDHESHMCDSGAVGLQKAQPSTSHAITIPSHTRLCDLGAVGRPRAGATP